MAAEPVTLRDSVGPPVRLSWPASAARALCHGLERITIVVAQAALLEASALVHRPAEPGMREPDPYATEYPFLSPGWPHD